MKLYLPILLLAIILANTLLAQDTHFTQYYASSVYLNPALAGLRKCPELTLNYRNQWPEIENSYVTYNTSFEKHSEKLKGGISFNGFHDRAGEGTLTTSAVGASYAHELQLNKKLALRFGVKSSIIHKSVNWNNLVFGDMIDPRKGVIYSTKQAFGDPVTFVDFSSGVLIYSDLFYAGIAVDHLTKPNEGLLHPNQTQLPRKYTFHAGAKIPFTQRYDENRSISPNILISQQQDFFQINAGVYLRLKELIVGAWYRGKDAFIILVGVETKKFRLGYSYDITTSQLAYATLGSHELSYTAYLKCRYRKKKYKTLSCPVF